ncbi:MAG: phospholipase A [Burkholderiaceae bacterium]
MSRLEALTKLLLCAVGGLAATTAPGFTYAQTSAVDQCLEKLVAQATDDQTMGELRAQCETGETEKDIVTRIENRSPAERRFASEVGLLVDRLGFMPHRPNLMLPLTYGEGFLKPDPSSKPYEIQFQVSLKLPFTPSKHSENPRQPILFFAYTGSAWWQAYNSRRSRPFREYNHAPEVFLSIPTRRQALGWNLQSFQFGFEHHSNGRDSGSSRSWNKLFTQFELDRASNHWLTLRSWWRIPEDAKVDPADPEGDDNPDITRFLGHNELRFGYSSSGLNWNMMLRRSLRSSGKGAAELSLSYPTGFNPKTRWTLRLFDGYGESLIDYNRRSKRIAFGLMLNDWY